jgi:hypothetical protein
MSNPSLALEAAQAPQYPYLRFNPRERKLLASVKDYVDQETAAIAGSHRVVAAGSFTTVGGDAAEVITIAGALSSDIAIVVLKTAGGTPRTIITSAAAAGQINVTLSGDPSTDHVLSYMLVRAQ